MSNKKLLKVSINKPVCVAGLSDDDVRQLVSSLVVDVSGEDAVVSSTQGFSVKFNFSPDGNFLDTTAKINNKSIVLLHGSSSGALQVFAGPPSNTNPGEGWEIDAVLTTKYLGQSGNQNAWDIFFARRVPVLNK